MVDISNATSKIDHFKEFGKSGCYGLIHFSFKDGDAAIWRSGNVIL